MKLNFTEEPTNPGTGTGKTERDFYIDIFDPEKFIDKSGFKVPLFY